MATFRVGRAVTTTGIDYFVNAENEAAARALVARVVPNATCDALILRPAISILDTLTEYKLRNGM